MTQLRRRAPVLAGAVAASAAIGGFVIGTTAAESADWHTVTAVVVGEQRHPLASVDIGGWTQAFNDSVPYWIDVEGATHEGGWPSCLKPYPVATSTQVPRKVPIRVATVNVDVDGLAWRQVVTVDCRPVGPQRR